MSKNKAADTRHMVHLICGINVIPVRNSPDMASPQVSQMLFGEVAEIIRKKNKYWFRIMTNTCRSEGWVHSSQVMLIDEHKYQKYTEENALTMEICHPAFNDDVAKYLVMGSTLPRHDGISFKMPDNKYIYNGQAISPEGLEFVPELISKIARRYMFAPEMPGGRSPFGIDAGALIQNTFRFFNINLPRTPDLQCMYGTMVDFEQQATEGDVAFCMDEDGRVDHAGILLGDGKVLHVYGSVRTDRIDHFGIFNKEIRRYTHRLRIIRRFNK